MKNLLEPQNVPSPQNVGREANESKGYAGISADDIWTAFLPHMNESLPVTEFFEMGIPSTFDEFYGALEEDMSLFNTPADSRLLEAMKEILEEMIPAWLDNEGMEYKDIKVTLTDPEHKGYGFMITLKNLPEGAEGDSTEVEDSFMEIERFSDYLGEEFEIGYSEKLQKKFFSKVK